MAGTRGVPAL